MQPPASRVDAASAIEEAQQRRHHAVASEANCANYEYRAPFQPGLAFFKLLVDAAVRDQPHENRSAGSTTKFEIPSFPVRVPPTLLRLATNAGDDDNQPFRLALLFTHEAKSGANAELASTISTTNNEDPSSGSSSSLALFAHVFATERQYREQRKVLLRLFVTDQQQQPHAASANSALAVSKHARDASCKSNATFLLKSAEDVEVAIDRLWNGTLAPDSQQQESSDDIDHCCAIQKYVPFKGASSSAFSNSNATTISRKAWIARPVYRKKDRASWIWILTDSANSEMTDSTSHDSCQLVKCTAAQSWAAPRLIASTCSHFFENLLRVSITELALDLIQDSDGRWWLLQVKAFQLRRQLRPSSAAANTVALDNETRVKSAPTRLEGSGSLTQLHKKWRCAGQYCNDSASDDNNQDSSVNAGPSGYLTKKVLLSCDFYEKYMTQSDMSVTSGFTDFSAALSFHLQHQISKRERNQLYESQPLCNACVTKYHFIREQWIDATTKVTTAPPTRATKTVRKKTQHGSLSSSGVNAPPRLLPSLQSTSTSALPSNNSSSALSALPMMKSSSAPAFERTSFQQSTITDDQLQQHLKLTPERPAYLSEMDKIEEMLTAHDARFASAAQSSKRTKHQQDAASLPPVTSETGGEDDGETTQFARFLQKRSEADSVEEMWKSISFKPISTSLSIHSATAAAGGNGVDSELRRPQVQYNSYSLANELEKQQQQTISGIVTPPESHSLAANRPESHHREQTTSSSGAVAASATAAAASVHTIAISSCKQVFYDEAYRERVVSEAKELLFRKNQAIRLVIVPSSIPQQGHGLEQQHLDGNGHQQQQQSHRVAHENDDLELAEMALRTLFLDLSQSAAATDRVAALLRKMPPITRESSGCTTMLLPALS